MCSFSPVLSERHPTFNMRPGEARRGGGPEATIAASDLALRDAARARRFERVAATDETDARALARALWAVCAAAALVHALAGMLVWLHAAERLSAAGAGLLRLALAIAALRHALAAAAIAVLAGARVDAAVVGSATAILAPLRTLRLASAAGACACAVALVAHLPVSFLAAACGLLACFELQGLAWAAMLLSVRSPGGLLARVPRSWLAAACEADALTLLEWSSRQVCAYWALIELWWGAILIGLSRDEIEESLLAGALPRSLHRWLHRPLISQLPPALLEALTADPTEGPRSALIAAVHRFLPRAPPPGAPAPPARSGAPAVPLAAAGGGRAGNNDGGTLAGLGGGAQPAESGGAALGVSADAAVRGSGAEPDSPDCLSSSSSERSADGRAGTDDEPGTQRGRDADAAEAAASAQPASGGGSASTGGVDGAGGAAEAQRRPELQRAGAATAPLAIAAAGASIRLSMPAARPAARGRPRGLGGGGLLVNSAGIGAFLVRVLAARLANHASWRVRLLRARASSERARTLLLRLITALACAAALALAARRSRRRGTTAASWRVLRAGPVALVAAVAAVLAAGAAGAGEEPPAVTRRSSHGRRLH